MQKECGISTEAFLQPVVYKMTILPRLYSSEKSTLWLDDTIRFACAIRRYDPQEVETCG